MSGKLLIIGFGPGSKEHFTYRAMAAIKESECILGYKTYVELIRDVLTNQEIIETGMSEEVNRAIAAVELAEKGKKVAVISSGDAGVYGMAGLIYEVLAERGWDSKAGIEVEVVPGISAINSCASLLGAPIMHDACTISLSDHLTPWDLIAKRIDAAGKADFVIALYNPKSGRRTRQIEEAQKILLKYRSPDTPVGLVKSAYRDREQIQITTLKDMLNHEIGMLTTVVIGNSSTFLHSNMMITPRGYQRKYTLNSLEQPLKLHERLREENEPWALHGGGVKQSPKAWAEDALEQRNASKVIKTQSIFEVAVSPGTANKKFTKEQMELLGDVTAQDGQIEYTPHHQLKLQIPTDSPNQWIDRMREVGFIISSVGDTVTVKACDFCDGNKKDPILYANEIQARLGGLDVPKELNIGFNGCGMACYGAVNEDIGIVHRRGIYELYIGGKRYGRNSHPAQLVKENIPPEDIVALVEMVVKEYIEKGHPNERFHKFFKRVKMVCGFKYDEQQEKVEPIACGD